MVRPKYKPGEETAYQRLSKAFWQLLEEMPYDKITIKNLSTKAQVNHNTFYYHFKDIDDMATKMIADTSFYEAIPFFLSLDGSLVEGFSSIPLPSDMEKHLSRMSMIAKNGSRRLSMQLHDSIMGYWLKALGKTVEDLSYEEKFLFNFIIGGIQSALTSIDNSIEIDKIIACFDTPLIQGVKETLVNLGKANAISKKSPVDTRDERLL